MKIAIITYHRSINYGSVLQSYALNKYLRQLGHTVETIDFSSDNQQKMYKHYEKIGSVMSIARNVYSFIYNQAITKKEIRFNAFIDQNIPLTDYRGNDYNGLCKLSSKYDLFLCGSDQIWNTRCYDFDLAYLLKFVEDKRKCCSYAASIGVDSLDKVSEDLFKKYISNFKCLSVRETTGAIYLEKIINRKIESVLDPVFLLSDNEWSSISSDEDIKEKFILGYYIGDTDGMRKFGEELAKKTNSKVIVILKNLRDVYGKNKKEYSTGPKEFLWLIEHAEYICTNSFHAVAFSVIFKKKFWVFVNKSLDRKENPHSRITDFTSILGLSDRVIDGESCEKVNYDKIIDWKSVYEKLNPLIESSKLYLNKCLCEEEYV